MCKHTPRAVGSLLKRRDSKSVEGKAWAGAYTPSTTSMTDDDKGLGHS